MCLAGIGAVPTIVGRSMNPRQSGTLHSPSKARLAEAGRAFFLEHSGAVPPGSTRFGGERWTGSGPDWTCAGHRFELERRHAENRHHRNHAPERIHRGHISAKGLSRCRGRDRDRVRAVHLRTHGSPDGDVRPGTHRGRGRADAFGLARWTRTAARGLRGSVGFVARRWLFSGQQEIVS